MAQRTLKPRTRGQYDALLTDHINPTLGDVELTQLTPQTVRGWYAVTLTDKPTYRRHAYALLHAICATAVEDELITIGNPCRIEKAMVTHRRREPVILTVGEVGQLADIIDERFKALVLVSAWCGLRWGEVSELRRKDVGADAETITVARGVTHRDGCHISSPKSGKARIVAVPPHVRADIQAHLDAHVGKDREALLFAPVRGGCHLESNSFRLRFNIALAKIGRQGVRVHDLRHFSGTMTARVGSLVETMGRLGHSTVGASLMYQQAVSGRDVEVAEALSKLAETDTT